MENSQRMKTLLCNEPHTERDVENSMELRQKFPGLIGDTVLPNERLSRTHLLA